MTCSRQTGAKLEERPLGRAAPGLENPLDVEPNAVARLAPIHPGHQKLVVARVLVAHGRDDREADGLRVQGPRGGRPPHPAASSHPGVPGDRLGPVRGTARKQPPYLARELGLKAPILRGSPRLVARLPTRPGVLVLQALRLGALEGRLLDEDPLAFVAPPRSAEPN